METSQKLNDVECEKNPGHKLFIPLSKLTLKDLPKSHRSLHTWALICTKAPLSVRLELKTTGPGAVSSLDGSGGGCVVGVDDSHTDKVALTVRTAAHLGYDKGVDTTTTLFLFIPGTGEVLESSNVQLKTLEKVNDIAILSVIFDKHSCADPNINRVLSDIQDALRANFDTLYQFVLRKYQTVPFPLFYFLEDEIRCFKSLTFARGKVDFLEIELQAAHNILIDLQLFITALVSHGYNLLELMGKIAAGHDINTNTKCSTVPVVNKQFSAEQTELLNSVKTALCKPLDVNVMREVESYLKRLLLFDISFQLKCSTVIVMRFGSPVFPAGVGIANGNFREIMGYHMTARQEDGELNSVEDREIGIKEQETDVVSDDNKNKEEYVQALSRMHIRSKTQETGKATPLTSEVLNAESAEGENSTLIDLKIHKKMQGKDPKTLAALISYPHNQQQQYVTLGFVKNHNDYGEVFYTTSSCPGSSGSPVYLIKTISSSGAELKDIRFATHSTSAGVGVLFLLPNNQE